MNKDPEVRKKRSLSNSGENNPFFGKTHSEETLIKLSNSLKGRDVWNSMQLSLILSDDSVIIFKSKNDFYRQTGISRKIFDNCFKNNYQTVVSKTHTENIKFHGARLL